MGLLDFLGFRAADAPPDSHESARTIRAIASTLQSMDRDKARYIAAFAFLLGRVAHADLEISDQESAEMQRIVEGLGGLPEDQAALVVEIAKSQNLLLGGSEDFSVAEEFQRISSREQKIALLNCLFAVSSADQSISTVEDNEIRKISRELKLDHADFIAARSAYKEHLAVLKKDAE